MTARASTTIGVYQEGVILTTLPHPDRPWVEIPEVEMTITFDPSVASAAALVEEIRRRADELVGKIEAVVR